MQLNTTAFEFAKKLLKEGKYETEAHWEKPSREAENSYIEQNGYQEYSKWYLGIWEEENLETKGAYAFEFTNDFEKLNLAALKAIDQRSGEWHYENIFQASQQLIQLAKELGYE